MELLLQIPFVMFGLLAAVTILQLLVAQSVTISAAREAARTLAVYHDANQAVQTAACVVSIIPTGGSKVENAVVNYGPPPHPVFGAQLAIGNSTPNPGYSYSFSPYQDISLYDDGVYCYAVVNYHAKTLSPGLPSLLQDGAQPWSQWLDLQGRAAFKKEI